MSDISQWDTTAANNNSAPPDGAPENMNYSAVNNTVREIMAAVAREYRDTNSSLTTAGTADAYTLTTNNTITSYAIGQTVTFIADRTNTGAATLNLNGTGAAPLEIDSGTDLTTGDIQINRVYTARHEGTGFVLEKNDSTAALLKKVEAELLLVTGDVLFYDGSDLVKLGIGAESSILTSTTGLPSWQAYPANTKTVVNNVSTSIALDASSMQTFIRTTSPSAVTITAPSNSTEAIPIDQEVEIRQAAGGLVTISAGSGATVNPPSGGTTALAGEGATVALKKVAIDTWDLIGQVAAS